MHLLEFFGQLNELRDRVFTRSRDNLLALYGTSRAEIPTHILMSSDNSDLKYADDIYIISLQPTKLKKEYSELSRKNRTVGVSQDEADRIRIIEAFSHLELDAEFLREMGDKLPAKIAELSGRPYIYKYITTDLGLSPQVYTSAFGEDAPEMDEDQFTQFHNARLIVPDAMKPNKLKIALSMLEETYQRLDASGEIDVFGGDIRFLKLPTRTAGEYSITGDFISINQNLTRANKSAVYTLLHEYGHKKMYTMMTPDAVKKIKEKYIDLLRSGESHIPDIDDASALLDATEQFQPGQQFTYIGRARRYKRNPYYIIKSVKDENYVNLAFADYPDVTVVEYPKHLLLNPKKWKSDDVDLTPPKKKEKHEIKTSNWFPTKYSESEYGEWWAELYAFYTIGNLSGEPAQWMQGMLHGNTTETVGSNEGELNSNSSLPPPKRGEEGVPEWEWTDPYHSSGTENAVLSNTP